MNVTMRVFRASARSLARSRWIIVYAAAFAVIGQGLFWFGGTGSQVLVSLLNIVLLVVPLVSVVFGAIHVYGSREFVEVLLAQPIRRSKLFTGLYLGLALPLAGAFAAGIAAPFILHFRAGFELGALAMLILTGVVLSLSFAAVATWIALAVEDRLRGVGVALGAWLLATIVYDGVVLAVVAMFGAYPLETPVLGMMVMNPVDLARVLVLQQLDAPTLMGYTGAVFTRAFGTVAGVLLAMVALAAWCGVPLSLAARRFRARDF